MPFPRARLALPLVAALLAACEASPLTSAPPPSGGTLSSRAPTATASSGRPDAAAPSPALSVLPAPSVTPTPPLLHEGFEATPLGDVPRDWVDVATEATVPAWVYAGNWRVVEDEGGNRVFMHDDVREQPAVSFQRYRGDALGTTDGELPARYHAEVAMRPIKSPHNYPPTGDQGVQFYYLGVGQYLEVVIKPDQIEVWEADGAEPKTSKGWKRLWNKAVQTRAGDLRRIGARVDMEAGTFEAWLDGERLTTVASTLIKPQPAWLALRGIGNVVSFDDVRIEPLR